MVRVMASGVFDLLHIGHLHYLSEAKRLGDELVVVVASDETVRKRKREPIVPQKYRAELVAALKPVDEVVLGDSGDMFATVEKVKPDIIALGYDQNFDERWLMEELEKRGLRVEVVRLSHYDAELDHTRKIIDKIIELWSFQKEMERLERGEKI